MTDAAEYEPGGIAIYHRVFAREDFKTAAGMLFTLVRNAARQYQGQPRRLFLDIDGHLTGRRPRRHYDQDMSSLLNGFIPQVLQPFLTEAHTPSGDWEADSQQEKMPDAVILTDDTEPQPVMLGHGEDGWMYLPGKDQGPGDVRTVVLYIRDST